ncbi:MAG: GNAT family N-acetyltransferase [Candidatus Acidiferrales bacterium]
MPAGPSPTLRIVEAAESDVPVLLSFIRKLADYEKLADQVSATEDGLRAALFGPRRVAEALLAYLGSEPVAFAVFFHNFSTFLGRPGIYLEDLFVDPPHRGKGVGKALLVELARLARARNCGRLEWAVLDWNESAINFYRSLGAVPMEDWTIFRLAGDALARLAGEESS